MGAMKSLGRTLNIMQYIYHMHLSFYNKFQQVKGYEISNPSVLIAVWFTSMTGVLSEWGS